MMKFISSLLNNLKSFFLIVLNIAKDLLNLDLTKVFTSLIELIKFAVICISVLLLLMIVLPFSLFLLPIYLYMTKETTKTATKPRKKTNNALTIVHNNFDYGKA